MNPALHSSISTLGSSLLPLSQLVIVMSATVDKPSAATVISCRRDLQIAPTPCADPSACGSYCSIARVTAWKEGTQSHSIMQSRRQERGLVIQQVFQLLKTQFRIYLLSVPSSCSNPTRKVTSSADSSRGQIVLQECSCMKLFVHLAKHIELLIYRSAFSKEEYSMPTTLLRRVQHFAKIMNCNPRWKVKIVMNHHATQSVPRSATKSIDQHKKRLWLFTPSRWEPVFRNSPTQSSGVIINANEKCYRSLMGLSRKSTLTKGTCHRESDHHAQSTRRSLSALNENLELSSSNQSSRSFCMTALFDGSQTAAMVRVFSFLDGHEIIRHFSINRLHRNLLSQSITNLRITTQALPSFLAQIKATSASVRTLAGFLPNLRQLCVYAEPLAPCDPPALSQDRKRKRASKPLQEDIPASSFRRIMTRTPGELGVTLLAQLMRLNGCPQLQKLCLCSTFVNSVARNGIFHLTQALIAGGCPELSYLWLGANALGDYGAMRVGDLLTSQACPQLSFLDIRSNLIGHDGMRYLSSALASLGAHSEIKQLCLGSNLITAAAFQELLPCFRNQSLRKLVFLGLERNFLTKDCLQSLATEVVSGHCPRLKELCVGGNAALPETEIATVVREIADSVEGSSWGLFRASSAPSCSRAESTRASLTNAAPVCKKPKLHR